MREATLTDAPEESKKPSWFKRLTRREWAIRLSGAAAVLLVVFVFVVFILPTPLARYVISSQLEQLGLEHDGIDTIDIDLWNSEVRAGPLVFHSGDARDGEIGETGFDYSFGAIFEGRAFIQTFYLRGLDLYVSRLENGSIEINGLNLQELGGAEEEEKDEAEAEPEEAEEGFAFGVESFEFTDSQLIFEDLSGGSLTIAVERLTLERLLSWTPEEPTAFALTGSVNEIDLRMEGTLLPLADPLRVTLDTHFSGVTLDRVAKFVGETGLTRQEGTLETQVSYDYAIHDSGLIEGSVAGAYLLSGVDLATEAGETITLESASMDVGLEQSVKPDGSLTAKGSLNLDASSIAAGTALGDSATLGSLSLHVEELDFTKSAEQRERLIKPGETGGEAAMDRAPSIIELMIGWARDIGRNILAHNLDLQGRPRLSITDAQLEMAAREGAPAQALSFDTLSLALGEVETHTYDQGVDGSLGLDALVEGLALSMAGGASGAEIGSLEIGSDAIGLSVTNDSTKVSLDIMTTAKAVSARDGSGANLALQSLTFGSEGFAVDGEGQVIEQTGNGTATGPISVSLNGLEANLPGTAGDMTLSGDALSMNLDPFTLTGAAENSASFSGSLAFDGVAFSKGGDQPLSASLASKRTTLSGINLSPLSAAGVLQGGIDVQLSGLSATSGSGEEAITLAVETLSNAASNIRGSGFTGDALELSLANETRLSQLSLELPQAEGPTARLTIGSLAVPLSELSAQADGGALAGGVEIGDIEFSTLEEAPQSLSLASVSLSGLAGGSQQGIEAQSLELGTLTAKVRVPKAAMAAAESSAGAPASGEAAEETPADSPPAEVGLAQPPVPVKLGSFSLAPGSSIEVHDPNQEPPLTANLRIDELTVSNIDSSTPAAQSPVSLAAELNETTALSLSGWASPFQPGLDFDLTSQVQGFNLPILSPYVAKAVGVNIESGALTAESSATSSSGALEGQIDLRIDDLFVAPISPEEAERLKANVGLPVGFAVGVLKNADGVIDLGFPLSGSVASPVVDYSEAINKAISGAMASLFPTNWFSEGGNSFDMRPATFEPGTTGLTEEGKEVVDHFGGLFAERPGLSIRACGRAARADLIAFRGGPPDTAPAPAEAPPPEEDPEAGAAAGQGATAAPKPDLPEIPPPSEQEVEALLKLATERGQAVREYLQGEYGVDPARLPECRTSYSIEDGNPPRAEFQF